MRIYKTDLTEAVINSLISLSIQWEQEDICYGYRQNTMEDIKKEDVFLVEEDGKVIGYLFCHIFNQEKETSVIPMGSRCLEIEELYIIPEYRSKGIGKKLYQFAEANYATELDFVTLGTATKNYQAILHFYIEEVGMDFWSARLFKKLEH